jgi:hypothetical protein
MSTHERQQQGERQMSVQRWLAAAALLVAVGFVLQTAPAVAHHSNAPFYDSTKKVEAEGTVTRFVFRNPHAFLYMNAPDAKGQMVEWQIELGAPISLTRNGWTPETLKPGTVIRVAGAPSRAEGSHGMCCVRLTRPDGSPIVAGGRVEEERAPR